MKQETLISIIITNYNYAKYINESIDSALSQSYPNIELIVVDDGSTDNSRELIKCYENRIISINITNVGQTGAANVGFDASHGEVVIFLDSDDCLLEGAVESLAKPLMNDDTIAKSQGYLTVVDKNGVPTGQRIPEKFDPSGDYKNSMLAYGLKGRCRNAYTSGNAWARWFLELVIPLPQEKQLAVDGCLNSICGLFGQIESIDQAVATYRVHGSNKGPVTMVFSAKSLRKIVDREDWCTNYLADWSRKLGHDAPTDKWRKHKVSWRRNLFIHSLDNMDGIAPRQSFNELVFSPFRTGKSIKFKDIGISASLTILWFLPKKQALEMARRMLGLQTK